MLPGHSQGSGIMCHNAWVQPLIMENSLPGIFTLEIHPDKAAGYPHCNVTHVFIGSLSISGSPTVFMNRRRAVLRPESRHPVPRAEAVISRIHQCGWSEMSSTYALL